MTSEYEEKIINKELGNRFTARACNITGLTVLNIV